MGAPTIDIPPSFDCARAAVPTEKAICTDPYLAKTDAEFAVYYQDTLSVVALFGYTALLSTLQKSERDFITARNACGANRWCIDHAYHVRDRQLEELVGEPHRVTPPLRLPDRLTEYLGADVVAWADTLVARLVGRAPPPHAVTGRLSADP